MATLCNFGENELPREVPYPKQLDADSISSFEDLEFFYRNYAIDVREDARYNPIIQRKVDVLCDNYDADQLSSSVRNLEWEELSAKRQCYDAIASVKACAGGSEDQMLACTGKLNEAKARLDEVLIKLTTLRFAIERMSDTEVETMEAKEMTDEYES